MKIRDIKDAASEESEAFKRWLDFCLEWEVETDHAGNIKAEELGDGAGITIAGLTTRDDGIPNIVEDLTPQSIVDGYYTYWVKTEGLPSLLLPIMGNYFLNLGQKPAVRLLQRSLQDYGEEVVIDGVMGDNTRAATFRVTPVEDLARAVINKVDRHYRAIAVGGNKERFLKGWINRNNALADTFLPA
jgi:lysozyme family protein